MKSWFIVKPPKGTIRNLVFNPTHLAAWRNSGRVIQEGLPIDYHLDADGGDGSNS